MARPCPWLAWLTIVNVALVHACSIGGGTNAVPSPARGNPEGGAVAGAGAEAEEPGEQESTACEGSRLRVFDQARGVLDQVYVDLAVGAGKLPFLIDMGSPYSFHTRESPDGGSGLVPDAGAPVDVSCARIDLPGYSGFAGSTTPD